MMLQRYDATLLRKGRCTVATLSKRATVYLDPDIHRALRLKSAETTRSVSELVNDALRCSLAEDAEDRWPHIGSSSASRSTRTFERSRSEIWSGYWVA
jgi:hypothetical protein